MNAKKIPPEKKDLLFDCSNIEQVMEAKRFLAKAKFASINPSYFIPGMCMQYSDKKYLFVRNITINEYTPCAFTDGVFGVFSISLSERLHLLKDGCLQPLHIYQYDASGTVALDKFKEFYCDAIRKMMYSVYDSGLDEDGNKHSPLRYFAIPPVSATVTGEDRIWNKGGLDFKFNDSTSGTKFHYISSWSDFTTYSQKGTKAVYCENDDSLELDPMSVIRLTYKAKFNSI